MCVAVRRLDVVADSRMYVLPVLLKMLPVTEMPSSTFVFISVFKLMYLSQTPALQCSDKYLSARLRTRA